MFAVVWLASKLVQGVCWLVYKLVRKGVPLVWRGLCWLNRHPRISGVLLVVVGLVLVGHLTGAWDVLAVVGLVLVGLVDVVGLLLWWRAPVFFEFYVWRHVRAWWLRWTFYARHWERWTRGCGLVIVDEIAQEVTLPTVAKVATGPAWDEVRVLMAAGQKTEDFQERSRELAHARRSARCVVRELEPGMVSLDFQRKDMLADLVLPPALDVEAEGDGVDLRSVWVGRDEYGRDLRMPLFGTHTLTAAETGAGKNSFTWAPYWVLAPAIRDGLVRSSGIDPKGIELAYGRGLFTRYATTPEQAVRVLEELVAEMLRREALIAGRARRITVSREVPLEILEFDEIAALTKYLTDKPLRTKIENLTGLLLTQGRALGIVVRGYVQEPTKETVVWRELFPFRLALALPTESYVDMVLGEGAYQRGARCDRIPEDMPGVGYVTAERRRIPVRARIAWTDDPGIRALEAYVNQPARGADRVGSGRVVEFARRMDREGGEAA
ncbi:FtsK/SpoIIIE domain-containing protein [Kutzneria albida]|uniref:FtsK/SpoIIIE domain-containing protein n=1 Tax=Kutzneria albida TaxID=43357 RepID=UPI00191BDA64|nr:FtsK/SpoIIIE domain-containing protein [Kutzneria albida]